MKISTLIKVTAASVALLVVAAPLAKADLMDDIKKAKKIRIASAMGTPLFSYVDSNLKPVGSDIETGQMIAAALGVEYELVEITNASRVPTVQTRKSDILVADLAITADRKKVIDFTVPYATLAIIVAAPKGSGVTDYASLKGKKVGLTRATVNDTLVTANAKEADIVRFEDDATLMTAAVSGQVDIVSTQTAVLDEINKRRASKPLDLAFIQQELNLGIALPQGEDRMKEWLNKWIVENFQNGKLPAMFKKYHNRDLPADLTSR